MNLQVLSLISTCSGTDSQPGLGSLRQSYSTCLENYDAQLIDNLESLGCSMDTFCWPKKQYKW